MKKLVQEFKALKTDKERWQWISANQDKGITVWLDNDDTFAQLDNFPDDTLEFNGYVGDSAGVFSLLEAMGIKAENV